MDFELLWTYGNGETSRGIASTIEWLPKHLRLYRVVKVKTPPVRVTVTRASTGEVVETWDATPTGYVRTAP